jgi:Cu+-exporting ATPase
VSQSYLTSLWNNEAFRKARNDDLNTLTNRYSRRFTVLVIGIAVMAALFWALSDAGRAVKAFASVLIVACPCALALAAPLTLGTAQRLLGRFNIFLKNALVIERMAQVDTVVLDKTGTLTRADASGVSFQGVGLSAEEFSWVYSLARQSTHPHSVRISEDLATGRAPTAVSHFTETPGRGIAGNVAGHGLLLGSLAWLASRGVSVTESNLPGGNATFLALDGRYRGAFALATTLRPEVDQLIQRLDSNYELVLLSGDDEREAARFRALFGAEAELRFKQSPLDKLGFIRDLQVSGRKVMMVGDGLNDSGALKQSDVGVAVVERIGAFSPASDVIMDAAQLPRLAQVLEFSRRAARLVRLGFVISGLYNVVGISIAAAGQLSPIVCAILMPLSSVSVVLFAIVATGWTARRIDLTGAQEHSGRNDKRQQADLSLGVLVQPAS